MNTVQNVDGVGQTQFEMDYDELLRQDHQSKATKLCNNCQDECDAI